MIIPAFLKENDTIAVTAPSDGNKKEIDFIRIDNAVKNINERGINVIETPNVRTSSNDRSDTAYNRADYFMSVWTDGRIKAVISAKGGDFLMEMLPYIDFQEIKNNPKWFQGFSDNTGLTFLITTICDIASVYTSNFNDFAMKEWHKAVSDNWDILCGKLAVQKSFDMFQDGFTEYITGDEGYERDKKVSWDIITGEDEINITGRFLGGCLDVLLNLVGTKFDRVSEFTEKYKGDGIIWYLETFSLSSEDIERGLWQLRQAGWFDTAKGFIFGREAFFSTTTDTDYETAVKNQLLGLNVPIILNADIGHKPPQLTMLNGVFGKLWCGDKKGTIEYDLFV